jgi:hypothetical protein
MPANRQFRFLTRHFFDRFFDRDSISPGSDPTANVIQAVGVLAVPGLMLTFWMRYSPYFFVSYSMIVMGFVMVFKWDSLFPDRRDYLILGSLPIRFRDVFLAKITALFLFLAIFAVSSNFFATLMGPGGGRRAPFWLNLIAHVCGVFGGALFMAVGFAALQGILIAILPARVFRRISPVIQMIAITALLTIFLIFPLIQASIAPLAERSSELMDYFPFFWFLGLYVSLVPGGDPNPIYGALALKALYGLGVVMAICVLTYAIAYGRHARSILDTVDIRPQRENDDRSSLLEKFEGLLLNRPVQRGSFRFIGEVLGRSSKHQVFLALYLAIGLSLALTSLFTINPHNAFPFAIAKDGMLALPVILWFFVVSGLRATFNIPYELQANWMFQTTNTHNSREHAGATRKWVVVCGLLPLALFVGAIELAYWPWRDAVLHLAFEAIVAMILVHVLFFSFRKVPFTCSYFPGKKNMAILAGVYLYGFTTYSSTMVALEKWLSVSPSRLVVFMIAGIATIAALSSNRKPVAIIYEERSNTELQTLELS